MHSVTSNAVYNTILAMANNNHLNMADSKGVSEIPFDYMGYQKQGDGMYLDFKECANIGSPFNTIYYLVMTLVPWQDASGGYPTQIAFSGNSNYLTPRIRIGIDLQNWSQWMNL